VLTLEGSIALCDLSEDEIGAIAKHAPVPDRLAVALANDPFHTPEAVPMIHRMTIDDLARTVRHGNLAHSAMLKAVLRHFIETHPAYNPTRHGPRRVTQPPEGKG